MNISARGLLENDSKCSFNGCFRQATHIANLGWGLFNVLNAPICSGCIERRKDCIIHVKSKIGEEPMSRIDVIINCIKKQTGIYSVEAALRTVLEAAPEFNEQPWIPVSDRMPYNQQQVEAYDSVGDCVFASIYQNVQFYDQTHTICKTVTHWKPREVSEKPELPESDCVKKIKSLGGLVPINEVLAILREYKV